MSRRYSLALVGLGLIMSDAQSMARDRPPERTKRMSDETSATKQCGNTALNRSVCMIQLMLADTERQFGPITVSGISQIKAVSSTSYTISIPRHERVQIFLYEFDVADRSVTIKNRTESVKSY